jgi:hypothetical protein
MQENKTMREKREREFQAKVLSILGKKKSHWTIRLINAPVFLWLMTVAVVTLGGAYINARQECRRDADDEISRFVKLQRELNEREEHARNIIVSGKSVAQIDENLSRPYYFYQEFSGQRFAVLSEAYYSLSKRIIDLPLKPISFDIISLGFSGVLYEEKLPDDLSDAALSSFQEKIEGLPFIFTGWDWNDFSGIAAFRPVCGPGTLLNRVLFEGPSTRIVESRIVSTRGPP